MLKTVWFWPTDIENQSIRYRRKKMKVYHFYNKKDFLFFFHEKWSHRKKKICLTCYCYEVYVLWWGTIINCSSFLRPRQRPSRFSCWGCQLPEGCSSTLAFFFTVFSEKNREKEVRRHPQFFMWHLKTVHLG